MHPVVLLLAGGAAFFAGLALLLAAALLRRHSTPRANRAAAWLALLAILALAESELAFARMDAPSAGGR